MKLMAKSFILSLLVTAGLMAAESVAPAAATEANHVRVFTTDNTDGKITPKTIQEAFEKAGFMVEANNDMLTPFKRDFNVTYHDVYNLMVLWKKDTVAALAEKYPDIGLFSPMSMSIYTPKGTKTISVSSLTAAAMGKMMNIPADNEALVALEKSIEGALKAAMPNGKFVEMPYKMKEPAGPLITHVTFDLEMEDDDWETAKDDLEMAFDGELAPNGFVSPAFVDLNYDLTENDKNWYAFYDVYSICKIKVIYTVSQKHPEAGAFAPCSMYLYMKDGDTKVHMAFPTVHKWISALNIEDKESIDVLLDAQSKYEAILKKLSGK